MTTESTIQSRIRELAIRNLPDAIETLKNAVRVPAEYVTRDPADGGDPLCGTSNHEGPRIELLRERVIELGAVDGPDDVGVDEFGNLWWQVEDPDDGVSPEDKTIIILDGHVDTVAPLRYRWLEVTGGGLDAYLGLVDEEKIDSAQLDEELGYLPPRSEWDHLVWGRGTADQLSGVVCQIFATVILRQLRSQGALTGVVVRSYATVAEEDNDGGAPMYYIDKALASGMPERVPDVVILTEPTGSAAEGALGIYRGQRGRMQIEVEVIGKSSHGAMPWEGKNPLEYGAAIISEAASAYERGDGIGSDEFLGAGSRTASFATLVTPSDCAVPEAFTFRLDRRLTHGEDPQQAVDDIEALPALEKARQAGLGVTVRAPVYEQPTWNGYVPGNPQIYPSWSTPEKHPAITAARDTYVETISDLVTEGFLGSSGRSEPRVSRWVFSTDGVGVPVPSDRATAIRDRKRWIEAGAMSHPAMFGIGPGVEENTHKIGECVDSREIAAAISFLACYPQVLRQQLSDDSDPSR